MVAKRTYFYSKLSWQQTQKSILETDNYGAPELFNVQLSQSKKPYYKIAN